MTKQVTSCRTVPLTLRIQHAYKLWPVTLNQMVSRLLVSRGTEHIRTNTLIGQLLIFTYVNTEEETLNAAPSGAEADAAQEFLDSVLHEVALLFQRQGVKVESAPIETDVTEEHLHLLDTDPETDIAQRLGENDTVADGPPPHPQKKKKTRRGTRGKGRKINYKKQPQEQKSDQERGHGESPARSQVCASQSSGYTSMEIEMREKTLVDAGLCVTQRCSGH
ncbi:uncharacterized protein [Hoplias malabaricus]|uniref:uncharacterized protein n=1 Tax=Hoplias malabaricus TaxID=27720 RepID=UPI00346217E5